MKLLTLTLALTLLASGAKDRNWKIARVLDSNSDPSSYVTGSTTNTTATATATGGPGFATANGQSNSSTTIHSVSVQASELLLAGEGYFYIIHDDRMRSGPILTRALANRKHGCRFVVGEDVKYSQEKATSGSSTLTARNAR